MKSLYVALVHYPVRNRNGKEIATAVTNIDLHDISRTSRTFGAKKLFIVTPNEAQHELLGKIISYWKRDKSREYHPDRSEAFSLLELRHSINAVREEIMSLEGQKPYIISTGARPFVGAIGAPEIKKIIHSDNFTRPVCVFFGTGWGLSDSVFADSDCVMAPVLGIDEYNHLSVRAASAVILDRLFGS